MKAIISFIDRHITCELRAEESCKHIINDDKITIHNFLSFLIHLMMCFDTNCIVIFAFFIKSPCNAKNKKLFDFFCEWKIFEYKIQLMTRKRRRMNDCGEILLWVQLFRLFWCHYWREALLHSLFMVIVGQIMRTKEIEMIGSFDA